MVTFCILLPYLVVLLAALPLAALVDALLRRYPVPAWVCSSARLRAGLALTASTAVVALLAALSIPLVPDSWVRARPKGRPGDGDVYVAFAFGLGRDAAGREVAGESNRALARWLSEHNVGRKPAVVQEGVYLGLKELEAACPGLAVDAWVLRLPHDPRVYVDTYAAAVQARGILAARGWVRPVLVAHDLQLQRLAWTFDELGVGEKPIIPELPPTPFDSSSAQHWGTRSRRGWLIWELFFARPLSLRPGSLAAVGLLALALYAAAWRRLRGGPRTGKATKHS